MLADCHKMQHNPQGLDTMVTNNDVLVQCMTMKILGLDVQRLIHVS